MRMKPGMTTLKNRISFCGVFSCPDVHTIQTNNPHRGPTTRKVMFQSFVKFWCMMSYNDVRFDQIGFVLASAFSFIFRSWLFSSQILARYCTALMM